MSGTRRDGLYSLRANQMRRKCFTRSRIYIFYSKIAIVWDKRSWLATFFQFFQFYKNCSRNFFAFLEIHIFSCVKTLFLNIFHVTCNVFKNLRNKKNIYLKWLSGYWLFDAFRLTTYITCLSVIFNMILQTYTLIEYQLLHLLIVIDVWIDFYNT